MNKSFRFTAEQLVPDAGPMQISAIVLVVLSVAFTGLAHGEEPVSGVRQAFKLSNYSWLIDGGHDRVLSIYRKQAQSPLGRYDLSRCSFCSGRDDNCDSDGVAELNIALRPKEPVLAVTCHVGAHSQRLQIFAPLRHRSKPVLTVTGAYYVTSKITSSGITIEYDRRGSDGNFKPVIASWP